MHTTAARARALLRERGLWVTAPRVALCAWFLDHPGQHRDVAGLRQAVVPAYVPRLAPATAYQAVHALVDAGILEVLFDPTGQAFYGLREPAHHHFYCRQCHQWTDIRAPAWTAPPALRGLLEQTQVLYVGRCAACAPKT